MKKKFLIIILCFTFVFSHVNFSFANEKLNPRFLGVAIAPELIATIATVAIGSGIILSSDDDVLDVSRLFYEQNKDNWDKVEILFNSAVSIGKDKVVNVGKDFLDLCKLTFDNIFSKYDSSPIPSKVTQISFKSGFVDATGLWSGTWGDFRNSVERHNFIPGSGVDLNNDIPVGDVIWYTENIYLECHSKGRYYVKDKKGEIYGSYGSSTDELVNLKIYYKDGDWYSSSLYKKINGEFTASASNSIDNINFDDSFSLPYSPGSYNWDNIKDNIGSDGSLGVYVPGNVGSLPGSKPNDVIYPPGGTLNPPYDLPSNGSVSIPGIENPSIGVGDSVPFPGVQTKCPECGLVGEHAPSCSLDKPIDKPIDPPIDKPVIPPFPSFGDSLDFSPMYLTNVTEKFPFSLPWDIKRLIDKFDVEPKAPIFKVPIVTEEIELDLTIFDEWSNIIRFFILIGFILSLILISTKLMG